MFIITQGPNNSQLSPEEEEEKHCHPLACLFIFWSTAKDSPIIPRSD